MDIQEYRGYGVGSAVNVIDGGQHILTGTVVRLGSVHASVVDRESGVSYDVDYHMLKSASVIKTAQNNVLKEDEKDGKQFKLIKDEENIDSKMSISYKITVDDEPIWESEELATNVYDAENGWSAPDDFDEQKLELIQQKAESGFELVVESYSTIQESISDSAMGDDLAGEGEAPKGEPAFAPGEEPDGGAGGGGGGGATMIGGDEGDIEDAVDEVADEEGGAPGPEASAETPEELPLAASLETPFRRSILAGSDNRLHGNPQHRISPITRNLMKQKGISSGDTNDLQLADALKDSNWGTKASIERLESKLKNIGE